MNKLLIISICLLLTACAIDTGIVPLTNHTFSLSKQAATGFSGIDGVRESVRQEASQFCANLQKTLKVISSYETQPPYIFGNFPKADITFACVVNPAE
jgi:glutathione S-transferase